MTLRSLSVADAADRFLTGYEPLLRSEGYGDRFVASVARELFEIVFERLPRGALLLPPIYQGLDKDFPGYSLYTFSEWPVHGTYTSNGEHVILLRLQAYRPAIPKAASRISAA